VTADPAIRDRLTRAADLVPVDVGSRLGLLYDDRHARVVRQRVGVFAVAALVALLAVVVVWRLLPLGSANLPAAPAAPSGTLAVMRGTLTGGDRVDFAAVAYPLVPGASTTTLADTAGLPAWSPDGSKLAYVVGPNHHVNLIVADGDGAHARRIATDLPTFGFAWSPDGGSIAVRTLTEHGARVSVINVATGAVQVHPALDGDWWNLAWSPDGTRFAFAGPAGLWVQDVDGSHRQTLVSGSHVVNPDWSPDGSMLAFACRAPGDRSDYRFDICTVNADGTGFVRFTDWAGWDAVPVWSPDGQWLAFASDRGGTPAQIAQNPGGARLEGVTIYMMRPDGSDVRQLLPASDRLERIPTDWRV
jgi:Tol biopolymer transport system component